MTSQHMPKSWVAVAGKLHVYEGSRLVMSIKIDRKLRLALADAELEPDDPGAQEP